MFFVKSTETGYVCAGYYSYVLTCELDMLWLIPKLINMLTMKTLTLEAHAKLLMLSLLSFLATIYRYSSSRTIVPTTLRHSSKFTTGPLQLRITHPCSPPALPASPHHQHCQPSSLNSVTWVSPKQCSAFTKILQWMQIIAGVFVIEDKRVASLVCITWVKSGKGLISKEVWFVLSS